MSDDVNVARFVGPVTPSERERLGESVEMKCW